MITSIILTVLLLIIIVQQLEIRMLGRRAHQLADKMIEFADLVATTVEHMIKMRKENRDLIVGLCNHLKVDITQQEKKIVFTAKK